MNVRTESSRVNDGGMEEWKEGEMRTEKSGQEGWRRRKTNKGVKSKTRPRK